MAARARQLAANADARERQHVEIMAAVIEGKPKVAVSGAEAHLEQYPRDALVLSMLLGAFGLYAFSGPPRPRRRQARGVRARRHALRRGLVVPELSRLVAYRSRQPHHRARFERTRDGIAGGQRQCGARPVARDVRARRHGGGPPVSFGMAARARPQEFSARASVVAHLADRARRRRSRQPRLRSTNSRSSRPTGPIRR